MSSSTANRQATPRQLLIAVMAIFFVALGVRLLMLQDARVDAAKVQSGVAADYQKTAHLISETGLIGLFDPNGPLADLNLLGHPPGYPIARSVVASLVGDSNNAIQLFQIVCDSLAAVLVFFIAFELLSFTRALIAGSLVAFAPQFAWNSVLLLPDTLAVLPVLLTMLLLIHALRAPRFVTFAAVARSFVLASCQRDADSAVLRCCRRTSPEARTATSFCRDTVTWRSCDDWGSYGAELDRLSPLHSCLTRCRSDFSQGLPITIETTDLVFPKQTWAS